MPLRRALIVTVMVLSVAVAGGAAAHDMFFNVHDYYPPVPGKIVAYLGMSHVYPVYEFLPYTAELTMLKVVEPNGKAVDLSPKGPMVDRIEIDANAPGTWVLAAETRYGYVSFTDGGAVLKPKSQVPGAKTGMKYRLSAKAVVCCGGNTGKPPGPVGTELEIVPLEPLCQRQVGERVAMQVLFRGKPLAGAKVQAAYLGYSLREEHFALTLRADDQGKFALPLIKRSSWLVVVDHELPTDNPKEYDRITYSATLTFSLEGAGRMEKSQAQHSNRRGKLILVGMGPGPRDLVTPRAERVIRQADIVICPRWGGPNTWPQQYPDLLAGKQIVEVDGFLFRTYKMPAQALPPDQREVARKQQQQRQEILARIRRWIDEGKRVVILDSGDPTLYGPCTWYLDALGDRDTEVVPGVSAFNAANAALKRDVARGKTTASVILTMRDVPGRTDTIESLATHRSTMVLFTMYMDLHKVVPILLRHYPADTPIAIVFYAGDPQRQKVIKSTLGEILSRPEIDHLPFEHIVYVGEFLRGWPQWKPPTHR